MESAFRALVDPIPADLLSPAVFGSVCLLLCWIAYFTSWHNRVGAAVRASLSDAYRSSHLPHPRQRLFYGAVRKKAGLDRSGLYAANLLLFWSLLAGCAAHGLLLYFDFLLADQLLVDALFTVFCVIWLLTQPASTVDRRTRWGFYRTGTVLRVFIREILILFLLAFRFYVVWFYFRAS